VLDSQKRLRYFKDRVRLYIYLLVNISLISNTASVPGGRNSHVKIIHSVIAMVPHRPFGSNLDQRYFVVEKLGLELAELGGHREDVSDDE
jgi:hypothetical protein